MIGTNGKKEGIGSEFLEELDHFAQQLLNNPNTHSFYEATIRQGKEN
jgi:hypothetical protein